MSITFNYPKMIRALVCASGLLLSLAVQADVEPRNEAERVALGLVDMAFNQKKPQEAWDTYGGPYYRQHNPTAADGKEAIIELLNGWLPTVPELRYDVKRVISQDDMVMIHSHVTFKPGDLGNAVVDIFRLENGKVVEHWDVGMPVPAESKNDNGVF